MADASMITNDTSQPEYIILNVEHDEINEYYALPEGSRKELIWGRIYDMAAPNRLHQRLSMLLSNTIFNYIDSKGGGCEVYTAPFDVHIIEKNYSEKPVNSIFQPDISVICDKDKLNAHGCEGAPDWIIEIVSPGSVGRDYYDKAHLYRSGGVREYWIVDPIKERILVNVFEDADAPLTIYGFSDKIPVHIYEGFEIDFGEISAKLS